MKKILSVCLILLTFNFIFSQCLGDLNQDDNINILDIIGLIDIILNEEPYNENGDMNSDGGINILDITQLVNIILN